jgi:hypothetical protein
MPTMDGFFWIIILARTFAQIVDARDKIRDDREVIGPIINITLLAIMVMLHLFMISPVNRPPVVETMQNHY